MNNSKREIFSYIIVGASTTLVNIIIYYILLEMQLDYRTANLIALVLCKIYAYFCNKIVVFKSHCNNIKRLLKECLTYLITRSLTGVIDYFGLIIAVELIGFHYKTAKYLILVIVVLLNYIFGKFVVFTDSKRRHNDNNRKV